MFCEKCGKEVPAGSPFCSGCGWPGQNNGRADLPYGGNANYRNNKRVAYAEGNGYEEPSNEYTPSYHYAPNPYVHDTMVVAPAKKKSSAFMIVLIVLLSVAIVAGIVVLTVRLSLRGDGVQKGTTGSSDASQNVEATEPFDRVSTYNSSYSYENMPSVHLSEQSDDKTSFELKSFVETYNNAWIKFVNSNNSEINNYLREGSPAHGKKESFKRDVAESIVLMDIEDVREYGSTYYVWTHEIIKKSSASKTWNAEYHWVYRIIKDGKNYYVEDYSKDPYYK